MTAKSNAVILEEQAVSTTIDGPLKSQINDILFAYIDFPDPPIQSRVSLTEVLRSGWSSGGVPSVIPTEVYPIYTPVLEPRSDCGFMPY